MLNNDIKSMGKMDYVLHIKLSLPPLEMFYLFHIACLLQNHSSSLSHAAPDLKGHPKVYLSK